MNFKEQKAIYLQIAEGLMNDILQDKYQEGGRIISVRECAADQEVNVNTCMRAYDWLCQQEVIFSKRGLGYFVCEGARKAILKEQRREFFKETLPEVAETMERLGITREEMIKELPLFPASPEGEEHCRVK